MGQPDVQALLSLVGNTPAYQLFLAGFDISDAAEAEEVGLVSGRLAANLFGPCSGVPATSPHRVSRTSSAVRARPKS